MKSFQINPVRKILLPTDFSSNAANATDYAVQLAKNLNSKLILYHATHIPILASSEIVIVSDTEKLEKESRAELKIIESKIRDIHQFKEIEVMSTSGFAVEEIARLVNEQKIDLVVMGTKGASGLAEVLMGSITAVVIEKAHCPVLAIPESATYTIPKRVVFSTNYADNDFQTLFLLAEILKPFHPEIIVLHVEENSSEKLEEQTLSWFKGQVQTNIPYDKFSFNLIDGKNVSDTLDLFITQNDVDMLVLSKRKRNFFDRLTSRSLTRKLAYHSHIPLLVFHATPVSTTPLF